MTNPIIGLGIDPGLAKTGIAAVARFPDGSYRSCGVRVSRTEPEKDRAFSRTRAAQDDSHRIHAHWLLIKDAIERIKPNVVGVENYLTFEPKDVVELREAAAGVVGFLGTGAPTPGDIQRVVGEQAFLHRFVDVLTTLAGKLSFASKGIGLGQAAKTIAVFGMVLGCAYAANLPVFVFQPGDIKRFGGRRGASKEEVGAGLEQLVFGLQDEMSVKVPQKTLKEHAWDATGHAILATEALAALQLDAYGAA